MAKILFHIIWSISALHLVETWSFQQRYIFEVRADAANNTNIGTVLLNSNSSSTTSVRYFISDVYSDLLTTAEPSPNWISTVMSPQVNECDPQTLWMLPTPRNQFCIDHFSGNIYTTQFFVESTPLPGTSYNVTVQVKDMRNLKHLNRTYVITVRPSLLREGKPLTLCQSLYNDLLTNKNCLNDFEIIVPPRESQNTISNNEPFKVKHIVEMQIDLSRARYSGSPKLLYIRLALVINDQSAAIRFTYNTSSLNTIRRFIITNPVALLFQKVGLNISKLNVAAFYQADDSTILSQMRFSSNAFKFIIIDGRDYCKDDSVCINKAGALIENNCTNYDRHQYRFKYGFCRGKNITVRFMSQPSGHII